MKKENLLTKKITFKDLLYLFFPFIQSIIANKKINKFIKEMETYENLNCVNLEQLISHFDVFNKKEKDKNCINQNCSFFYNTSTINTPSLVVQYNDSIERKKQIEDKAKINTITLTISATLLYSLPPLIHNENLYKTTLKYLGSYTYPISFIGLLALFYIFIAAIISINVLILDNKVYTISEFEDSKPDYDRKKYYYKYKELNNLSNLKRYNSIFSAYRCIIYSLSTLGILCFILLFPWKVIPYILQILTTLPDFILYALTF